MGMDESNQRALRHRKATRRAALGPYARVDARENSRLELDDLEDDQQPAAKRGGKGFLTRWLSYVPIVRGLVAESESEETEEDEQQQPSEEEDHTRDVDMEEVANSMQPSREEEEEEDRGERKSKENGTSDKTYLHTLQPIQEKRDERDEKNEEGKVADGHDEDNKWFQGVKTLKSSAKEDFKIAPGSIFDLPKALQADQEMDVPTPAHGGAQHKEMNPVEEALHCKSVMELKRDLHAVKLSTRGKKEELVKRFEEYVDSHPDAKKQLLEAQNSSKSDADKEEKSLTPVPVKRRLRTGSKSEDEEQKHEAIATDKSTHGVKKMSFGTKNSQGAKHLRIADKEKSLFDQAQSGESESRQESSFAFKRISRRRQSSPSSSSPMESPVSVIQKRKTITLQEYEKLSETLRRMIDPAQLPPPQSPLSLVQSAFNKSLEQPMDFGSHEPFAPTSKRSASDDTFAHDYYPGSISDKFVVSEPIQSSSSAADQQPSGVPFGKRLKRADSHEIVQKQLLMTREERRERRPRPSRLLTGSKRDERSRSAYSTAVAQKVLATLTKLKGPLEKEATGPTPSSSLSWAKHHLALMERAAKRSNGPEASQSDEGGFPPTKTIPRVDLPAAPFGKFEMKEPNSRSVFQQQRKKMQPVLETPQQPKSSGLGGSFLSPPTVSFTPGEALPKTQAVAKSLIAHEKKRKTGVHSFTFPEPVKLPSDLEDDHTINYVFSSPPALREPPPQPAKRVKATPVNANTAAVKAFNFVPASPKSQSEGTFPTNPPKIPSSQKPTPAAKPAPPKPSPPAALSDDNPLAKFLKTAPGSWKCPTCAVQNEEKYNKCPCCETDKPGGSKSTTSEQAKQPASGGLSFGSTTATSGSSSCGNFSFGVAPGEKKESDSTKPSSSFGLGPTPSKGSESTEKPSGTSTGGFTFGALPTGSTTESTKPSFSCGVTSSKSESATVPSFAFAPTPATNSGGSSDGSVKPSFAFGATTPTTSVDPKKPAGGKRKAEDSSCESKPPAPSFQFGDKKAETLPSQEPAKPNSGFAFGTTSNEPKQASSNATPSFSFGATPAAKPSTADSSAPASKKPAFGFGASAEAKEQEAKPAFAFGSSSFSASKPAQDIPIGEKKTAASTFGGSESKKTEAAKPVVTFGVAPTTTPEPVTPAFSFGAAPAAAPKSSFGSFGAPSTNAEAKKDEAKAQNKPAFSFGASSSPPKPAAADERFAFGSTTGSTTSPAPAPPASQPGFSFGQNQANTAPTSSTTTSVPSFAFGSSAPSTTQPTAQSAPFTGFTFGASSTSSTVPPATSSSTTAFGSSAPSFGQTATPAPNFGTATPSFGNAIPAAPTPAPTVGDPSFGFGAGTSQPAQHAGFGAPSPATPSFSFGASAAPSGLTTFGAPTPAATPAPAPAFGATSGFGGSSTPSFGSSGAGAAGFGAPTPGGFGAPPASGGFNVGPTPAPSFGPSGAPGFGAPGGADGGFNMGAAPQAAKGRRILRARSNRTKR